MVGKIKVIKDGVIKVIKDGEIKVIKDGEMKVIMKDGEEVGRIKNKDGEVLDTIKVFGEIIFKEVIGSNNKRKKINTIFFNQDNNNLISMIYLDNKLYFFNQVQLNKN